MLVYWWQGRGTKSAAGCLQGNSLQAVRTIASLRWRLWRRIIAGHQSADRANDKEVKHSSNDQETDDRVNKSADMHILDIGMGNANCPIRQAVFIGNRDQRSDDIIDQAIDY